MDAYTLYVAVAALTIALPGPGVLLTVNNAARRGFSRSMAGIFGISAGVLVVAAISATGLGILLTKSATAFMVMRYLGALYLIYLGVKIWRTKNTLHHDISVLKASLSKCFCEGLLLSLSNPKSIIFFMSIFPQFINTSEPYVPQFLLLASTFGGLIVAVHTAYVVLTGVVKAKFFKYKGMALINKITGGLFASFGIGLAASKN